jgi:3-phosphoshikimate 1-carboxyvinyltransferase
VKKSISINQKINSLKKKNIFVEGDKSLSIRFILLSSLSKGRCVAKNLLKSEDVISSINCIKKLGIKIRLEKSYCEVFGKGLNGYKYKRNIILNAGNSGTTARLLCATLIDAKHNIKITGDKSLRKRDMSRIINPLLKFGVRFKSTNKRLPLFIKGPKLLKPISYNENLGSAQCKSAVMIAALKTQGKTKLKCLPSRNHTEIMFKKVLKIPIKIQKLKNYELIKIDGLKEFNSFNYNIPGDISSAAFFIVLTLLSKNSFLTIKKVNINPSRTGVIKILNKMGAQIKYFNKKNYKGEIIADIFIKSETNLKSINLDPKFNSSAIDEFLLIFLVASKCEGVSTFKNLSELNKKESERLNWGIKILKMMGIKVIRIKNDGIKILGQKNLQLNKKYIIKNFLKDHRVFMVSTIAALTLGGDWKIHDPDSYKTSFPSFLKILKNLGAKIK